METRSCSSFVGVTLLFITTGLLLVSVWRDHAVVSVFAGQIADTGVDPMPLMRDSLKILSERPAAELLWASVREVLNIFQASDCGCDIVMVPHDILAKVVEFGGMDLGELSLDTVRMFHQDALAARFNL